MVAKRKPPAKKKKAKKKAAKKPPPPKTKTENGAAAAAPLPELADKPEPGSIPQSDPPAPEKRGPGRPPGSKTKEKPGVPAPRAPRRSPRDTVDLDHAIPREANRWNALLDEYDVRHGTNTKDYRLPEKMAEINKPKVVPPPGACGAALGATCEVLGQMWEVEARPDPKALEAADEAWRQVFVVFDFDPKYLVIGAAVGTTAMCVMPMYKERRQVQAGSLPPASERSADDA